MAMTAAPSTWRWQVGTTTIHLSACLSLYQSNVAPSAAPPTFETIMEDLDVCVGETPCFAVVVEGRPIPDILWLKVFIPVYVYRVLKDRLN